MAYLKKEGWGHSFMQMFYVRFCDDLLHSKVEVNARLQGCLKFKQTNNAWKSPAYITREKCIFIKQGLKMFFFR